jgi:hypothetical protein
MAVTTGLWLRRRACDGGGLPGVELIESSPRDAERARAVDVMVGKSLIA